MNSKWKWLLLPPAAAVVLLLGPLRGAPEAKPDPEPARPASPAQTGGKTAAPGLPDVFTVGSALIGVLLLGGVGLALFAKLRGGSTTGDRVVALRQSLRLSPRHRLHVVELDARLLLLGECDGNLTVLGRSEAPEAAQDERTVAARANDERMLEEGATPPDLVLRPHPGNRRRESSPPRTANSALTDFRALLRRARVPSGT